VQVTDTSLDEVREQGFTMVEGFPSSDELRAAQQALWGHFPIPEDDFADTTGHSRYAAGPFAGAEESPHWSRDLNRLAVHPDLIGAGRARLSLLADYQVGGTAWAGKMIWPKQALERWATFMPCCTVRRRDDFGFPSPGDGYWNEQTPTDVGVWYPGMDLTPYRPAARPR